MLPIAKSILLICAVSSISGTVSHYFYGISFTGTFILTTIAQLVLGYFVNTYLDSKEKIAATNQQDFVNEYIETHAATANCAYCGAANLIPIVPDGNNDFECTQCGKQNAVYMNITVAQTTTPVDMPSYEISNANPELHKIKQQIISNEQ